MSPTVVECEETQGHVSKFKIQNQKSSESASQEDYIIWIWIGLDYNFVIRKDMSNYKRDCVLVT